LFGHRGDGFVNGANGEAYGVDSAEREHLGEHGGDEGVGAVADGEDDCDLTIGRRGIRDQGRVSRMSGVSGARNGGRIGGDRFARELSAVLRGRGSGGLVF